MVLPHTGTRGEKFQCCFHEKTLLSFLITGYLSALGIHLLRVGPDWRLIPQTHFSTIRMQLRNRSAGLRLVPVDSILDSDFFIPIQQIGTVLRSI